MAAAPRSGLFSRRVAAAMGARSSSVAASSSSRLRWRSAASSGLRHTMSRSPGNSSLVTSAKSRSSNSDGVTVPALTSLRMVGARSVVIQRSPSTPCRSSRMRAAVSIPRSPTSTTCCKPNRSRIFATWLVTVSGSTVEPSKTSTATGQPSAVHSSPKTICNVPFLPSRLYPCWASGQCVPST